VILKLGAYPVTIIVVDDGSSDQTAYIAQSAGAEVIRHTCNQGKGVALNTGLKAARELEPDAIVFIDGDGQHLPEQLPNLVFPILSGKADLVIGSRYLHQPEGVPRHRVLGHHFFNVLTRLASGVPVSDSQSGYRALSRRAFCEDIFHSSGFSVESEMQFLAHEYGLKVMEVPISVRYTDRSKRSVWQQGLVVFNGVVKLTGQYRPLFFFGVPGMLLLLFGIGAGFWVAERFLEVRQIAIGTALLSLLASMFGLVMLSTGFTLHSVRGLLLDMLRHHLRDNEHR
jgi:glycosyltransferase involved in cell wall biosynthesis